MAPQPARRASAVAGSWYPGHPATLLSAIDGYLGHVSDVVVGDITALVAPHAGLMYSGPVAAHAYRQLAGRTYDVVVLVGPSHHIGFEGVAIVSRGVFETPLGDIAVSADDADTIIATTPVVCELPAAHRQEHSLEMQLPFLQRLLPGVPIVPLVMGHQSRAAIAALSEGLASAMASRRALLVASSDLSHYHDSRRAAMLDRIIVDAVDRFDPEAVERALARDPGHACGGGPIVSVMRAARALGAADARVLCYADSGAVSGDTSAVVGYCAAVFGTFEAAG
ncbi:MAG: AmmeMemoRadiSam system protein B [Vicinamibacterales bacterium]|nr:AmmeMemoRadiSam system protein B [Vicinamibacterales bacterium]